LQLSFRCRGLSFVWQQKKQKCQAPGCSATCSFSMAKLQKLAALRQFAILNAIFKQQVPACATEWRGKNGSVYFIFGLRAAPKIVAGCLLFSGVISTLNMFRLNFKC
jgi:hypothetical protein